MKKVFGFIKNLSKWAKISVPLVFVAIIVVAALASSFPKTYPEGAIVSKRNESCDVIYNNRAFIEYSTINKFSDVTEKRVDILEKYSIIKQNNYYKAVNLSSDHVLVKRDYYANLTIYLSLSEIPYYKGSDLYEKIFKLSENTENYCYLVLQNGDYNNYNYYRLNEEHKVKFRELFEYLNEADFMYKDSLEDFKSTELNYNEYFIEAEFENGFVYGVRLYEGGYVIPCGAGDICQKIPDSMYRELKEIMDNENSGEYLDNTAEYNSIVSLEDVDDLGSLEKYMPTYFPEKVFHKYMGMTETEFGFGYSSVEYGYNRETGKIEEPERVAAYGYTNFQNRIHIEVKKKSYYSYVKNDEALDPENFTEAWLSENYRSSEIVNEGRKNEHTYYNYSFELDYGDVVVKIQTEKIELEDVYRIVKSINP